jgi:NADP-dependent 3-hydroxy acid dehydrogenase YdfG
VLSGKTVVVTGASRGIGRAVASAFAGAGAWVAMVARGGEALRAAAEEVGGHAIPADVASADAVHRLTTYLVDLLGDVPDILVNSAGAFSIAPFSETEPAEFARLQEVNLRAPFLMIRAFLPYMLERRSGHLISIGSVAGRRAFAGNAAYSASKFGLRGLHEVLDEEVRGTGVRATLLEPAATDTPLWDPIDPDARADLPSRAEMLRAEDVARGVLFAASQPLGVEVSSMALRANF